MSVPEDLLDLYFRDIGRVPLLTAEEQVELARRIEDGEQARRELASAGEEGEPDHAGLQRRIQAGNDAFERFVSANLRLVVKEASKFGRRSPLELGELIQEGSFGLIRAVEKFDWRRGLKFSTYATWWIRQALQRGSAGKERTVRLPLGVHTDLLKVRAAQSRLAAELGRPPCLDELARATNLNERDVRRALEADLEVISLDRPVSPDGEDGAELGALVARSSESVDEKVVDRLFLQGVLDTAREHLSERSWQVIARRYGLTGQEPATLERIGRELGMSREAVRKIEQRALAQLHEQLTIAA